MKPKLQTLRNEGRNEGHAEVVRNLLKMKFSVAQIMEMVGMTRQEIESLQK